MRYAIITNPASGNLSLSRRRKLLADAARILQAGVYGLDAGSKEEFVACARELAEKCDVLVVAGGDGSLSDIINAIDTRDRPIAYIPLGSGNAMGHALHIRGSVPEVATRIREGQVHEFDLVQCDERRLAYMASIGLEGAVIKQRDAYRAKGASGFRAYLAAFLMVYFVRYQGVAARINVDGQIVETRSLLSLMITKQPYYGYGLKVMPGARLDDRRLHVRVLHTGWMTSLVGGATSLTVGNRAGFYRTAERVSVFLERPLLMQTDGDVAWEAKEFRFTILSKALRIKA
ncbi:MAG TPA: diacylglycerol kinase family protein [Desulfatiglandales bacterium]